MSALSIKSFILFQVRDLEERLVEKEHELKQMRRNLDESEDAIAQVNLIELVFDISHYSHLPPF